MPYTGNTYLVTLVKYIVVCTSSVYDTSELSDKVQTIEIENNGITVATYLTVVVAHNYQSSRM